MGQICRIVEQQSVFLPGTPSFGVTEGKNMCNDYGDGVNIYNLPVLSLSCHTADNFSSWKELSIDSWDILCREGIFTHLDFKDLGRCN